jgi:hypothetical protein
MRNTETNQTSHPRTTGRAKRRRLIPSRQEGHYDDAESIFCTGKFSEDMSGEKWINCPHCLDWCHEDFVRIQALNFIYDLCKMQLKVSDMSMTVKDRVILSVF